MNKGPFIETGRVQKYANDWLRLEEAAVVRPNGAPGLFGLVYLQHGATVLALDGNRHVLLIKEYKYAVDRETIELISGAIDPGETPTDAAIRELHEETGYVARTTTYIGAVDPFTTVISGPVHLVLAQELEYRRNHKEGTDVVEPFRVPFDQALEMVENGTITHAPSCVAILRVARIIGASVV